MSSATSKLVAVVVTTLIVALGLGAPAGSAAAASGGFCEGQSAPANDDPANQAPVPGADTVAGFAGTVTTIKVLANDTDPDGDRLYLENASTPRRGQICVQHNGTIQYLADASRTDYSSTFTYGVTDGDRYRTGTVTVNVEGLTPMRPVLQKRLELKHGHQVKQRARVAFTNANKYRMLLVAGNPKKKRPSVQHYVYPGHTFTFSTKERRLAFFTVLTPRTGDSFTFVNQGLLNTRNGRLRAQFVGATFARSTTHRTAAAKV